MRDVDDEEKMCTVLENIVFLCDCDMPFVATQPRCVPVVKHVSSSDRGWKCEGWAISPPLYCNYDHIATVGKA